ncbi:hypothetical protein CAOG_02606 [Capsaspora owczarzaki ATCC 30864]|uniref:SAM domain-containing protein n=1 Tax=Capsaspora owczarzaki (strain ATCC 30864) TaxID=595528 RepID=A0A0D2U8S7_CAPO3|nr:hypothetical protein CAOG_02606 [Capsaspora owczarzaki ATCC 30864]KJE91476.1 hypothetical protein CAOG_002606 [Capsaspora owczarzaki ATCC 30864]|eukprot:XP_004349356.1 hypothetical protein CAOG_02606 [Capsaspora owczarzaki ATCC 30864]
MQFKVSFGDDCRRIVLPAGSQLAQLKAKIREVYAADETGQVDMAVLAQSPLGETMLLKYRDTDGDLVTMAREEEFKIAVDLFRDSTLRVEIPIPSGASPRHAAMPAQDLSKPQQAAQQKKVSFRPGPASVVTFETPPRTGHLSEESSGNRVARTMASSAQELQGLSPQSVERSRSVFGDELPEAEIVQILRDISFFITARVDGNMSPMVSDRNRKSLITPRGIAEGAGAPGSPGRGVVGAPRVPSILDLSTIHQWTAEDVAQWMGANGFAEYIPLFQENDIDGEALLALDHETLGSMSITSAGRRLRILRAIATLSLFALDSSSAPPAAPAADSELHTP